MKLEEPIVEKIAQWLLDAIKEITVGNGYHQTLDVSRPEDVYIAGEKPYNDLSAVINQVDSEIDGEKTISPEEYFWRQIFEIHIYCLADAAGGLSMDQKANRAAADVQKRIGLEMSLLKEKDGRLCNGLAHRPGGICPIDLLPIEGPVAAPLINATIINVPIIVAFNVDATNPYCQIT